MPTCQTNIEDDHVSLIIHKPEGIVQDVFQTFSINSINSNKSYTQNCLEKEYSRENIKKSSEFIDDYNSSIENDIVSSKLVVFVATNDSVESDKCKKLLQLSKDLKKRVMSLIIEQICNYEELKSTVLTGIDHHFEVFKDRVYDDGYDPYMCIGEEFERFILTVKQLLGVDSVLVSSEL
jgi:hypothetical protein